MLGINLPKMFLGYLFLKRKGNGLFLRKIVFHKSSLLMTPCYGVTISGKECFIKLEWVVQLR